MIGMGRQAHYSNLPGFLHSDDARVIAVCDVDQWRLDNAKKKVDDHYQNSECKAYTDWREIISRDDVDAVMNSTSDQWHVPISLLAVNAGKHVCCEKPISLSVAEGRILADAAKKKGVVFRTDTECRTNGYMHKTAILTRNGYIGKVKHIKVGVPAGDKGAVGNPEPMPVPPELDYEMWTGPAPMKPYCVDAMSFDVRGCRDKLGNAFAGCGAISQQYRADGSGVGRREGYIRCRYLGCFADL